MKRSQLFAALIALLLVSSGVSYGVTLDRATAVEADVCGGEDCGEEKSDERVSILDVLEPDAEALAALDENIDEDEAAGLDPDEAIGVDAKAIAEHDPALEKKDVVALDPADLLTLDERALTADPAALDEMDVEDVLALDREALAELDADVDPDAFADLDLDTALSVDPDVLFEIDGDVDLDADTDVDVSLVFAPNVSILVALSPAIDPEDVADLDAADLAGLDPADVAGLDPDDLEVPDADPGDVPELDPDDVAALDPDLDPEDVAELDPEDIAALDPDLDPEDVADLDAEDLEDLDPEEIAALDPDLDPDDAAALDPDDVLAPDDLDGLGPEALEDAQVVILLEIDPEDLEEFGLLPDPEQDVPGDAVDPGEIPQDAEAEGEPGLDVLLPDNDVVPGRVTPLELQVTNDGELTSGSTANREIVTTARDVRVEAEAEDPLEVETGEQSLGPVPEAEPRQVPIQVFAPADVDADEYDLDVEVEYTYVAETGPDAENVTVESETVSETLTVEVDDRGRFEIVDAATDAPVGGDGTLALELENVGDETVEDATVVAESPNERVRFGESPAESAYVDEWDPGEVETVEYDVGFAPDASERAYPIDVSVRFTDPDGVPGGETNLTAGVEPLSEQDFEVGAVESTLRVGERGVLTVELENVGPGDAENVVVGLPEETGPNVVPIEPEIAVGTLEEDDSTVVEFPIEIGSEAEPVPRQFTLPIRYRTDDGDRQVDESEDVFVEVADARDEFLLDVDEPEIEAGTSTTVTVNITNNRDETVTDVEGRLFADDPLDADDEAYVEELDPGETETVQFSVSAGDGATPRTYPISLDFRYDDERGQSQLTETFREPVTVTAASDDGWPLWPLVVGIGVVGIGLTVAVRR